MRRHVVLITYGEPPTPDVLPQLTYSWRILLGLTRSIASIPAYALPIIAISRARSRHRLWTDEEYASPIEAITRAQAADLGAELAARAPGVDWQVHVAYEFRDPLLVTLLDRLPKTEPVDIVPMYAADSAFTHEISRRTVLEWSLKFVGGRPAPVRVLPALDERGFAEVAAAYVAREIGARNVGGKDWALLLAAHGTLLEPEKPIETGREPTERICAGIAERLRHRFGMVTNGWLNHTRGGRWTEPAAEVALRRVAEAGYRKVVYYPYGFSADNAESELEGRIALRSQTWEDAVHLPCLNRDPDFIRLIAAQVAAAAGAVALSEPLAAAR